VEFGAQALGKTGGTHRWKALRAEKAVSFGEVTAETVLAPGGRFGKPGRLNGATGSVGGRFAGLVFGPINREESCPWEGDPHQRGTAKTAAAG
jgi:hypothetical protein